MWCKIVRGDVNMCFFRKKKDKQVLLDNKYNFENIAEQIKGLEVLVDKSLENGVELLEILSELEKKIRYFYPSKEKEVQKLDNKIMDKVGDLRIELTKARNNKNYEKSLALAKDLKDICVVERQVKQTRR